MYYLSLAAIVKDEAPYIKEWLDFHIKQGVEHFYIYDNESSDYTVKILNSYGDLITLHKVAGLRQQLSAYNHVINSYKAKTKFCAFIDCDEFLYSTAHPRFVDTLSHDYETEELSVLAVHWLLFGSSGHTTYSPEPVTKRFTRRAATVNPHVKSIVRLIDAFFFVNPHEVRVENEVIDETGNLLKEHYALSEPATADILRINHYVTKSKLECAVRRNGIRADTGQPHGKEFFEVHDCNDVEDKEIWKVL